MVQGTFMRISFAFADSTTVLPAFILKLTSLKHACRLDRFDDASRLDVAPTPNLESARTPSAQDALLRPRYELSTVRMDRNGYMHPYGRLWQQRLTCCVFSLLLFYQIFSDGSFNASRIWILSLNPLNHSGGPDISACAS